MLFSLHKFGNILLRFESILIFLTVYTILVQCTDHKQRQRWHRQRHYRYGTQVTGKYGGRRTRLRDKNTLIGHGHESVSDESSVCEKIKIGFCKDVPYNLTKLPNVVGHQHQHQVRRGLKDFRMFVRPPCHADIKFFICSVYLPACDSEGGYGDVLPCRSVCHDVKRSCEHFFLDIGLDWPHMFDCERFPVNSERFCLSPGVNLPSSFIVDSITETRMSTIKSRDIGRPQYMSFHRVYTLPETKPDRTRKTKHTAIAKTTVLRDSKPSVKIGIKKINKSSKIGEITSSDNGSFRKNNEHSNRIGEQPKSHNAEEEIKRLPKSKETITIGNKVFNVRKSDSGSPDSTQFSDVTLADSPNSDHNHALNIPAETLTSRKSEKVQTVSYDDAGLFVLSSTGFKLSDRDGNVEKTHTISRGDTLPKGVYPNVIALESVESEDTILVDPGDNTQNVDVNGEVLTVGSDKSNSRLDDNRNDKDAKTNTLSNAFSDEEVQVDIANSPGIVGNFSSSNLGVMKNEPEPPVEYTNFSHNGNLSMSGLDHSPTNAAHIFSGKTILVYSSVIFVVILTAFFFNKSAFNLAPKKRLVSIIDE